MRVFIICTGRSGSTAIIKACKHITNFTSGHETRTGMFGVERFSYPDNHIEADNRLSWHLGQLDRIFGDNAYYIHLKRDREKVAQSFMRRFYHKKSMIESYCEGIKMTFTENLTTSEKLQACYEYIDTVTSNIDLFLSNKTNKMCINLENIETDFPKLWKFIKAEGRLDLALNEFNVKHNASKVKIKYKLFYRLKHIIRKEWKFFLLFINYNRNNTNWK